MTADLGCVDLCGIPKFISKFLAESFTLAVTPAQAVGWAEKSYHPDDVILGSAAWITGNDDFVACFDTFTCDVLLRQFSGSVPCDVPALHLSFRIRRFDNQQRMRTPERERNDRALDLDCLAGVIERRNRVVRVYRHRAYQDCENNHDMNSVFHSFLLYLSPRLDR